MLGHLLAVLTSPVNEQDRAQVKGLCLEVQEVTGVNVAVAFANQGCTGEQTAGTHRKQAWDGSL